MNLPLPRATPAVPTHDLGFAIGWEHARRGLVPPPEHLLQQHPVRTGWQAGKAAFGHRTLRPTPAAREWLTLRLEAWMRGADFDDFQLTPNHLRQVQTSHCPVLRCALSQDSGRPTDLRFVRLRPDVAYAAGALACVSAQVADAMGHFNWQEALVMREQALGAAPATATGTALVSGGTAQGLTAAQWGRLAVLMSFITPMPQAEAARLPLLAMPPNRLRLLNPIQALQVVLTRLIAQPGHAAVLKRWGERVGQPARAELHRFASAMLARVLPIRHHADALVRQHAMEDAWMCERVNCRWQLLATALSAAQVDALLQDAQTQCLAGRMQAWPSTVAATEAWALDTQGQRAPVQSQLWDEAPASPARLGPRLVHTKAVQVMEAQAAYA